MYGVITQALCEGVIQIIILEKLLSLFDVIIKRS